MSYIHAKPFSIISNATINNVSILGQAGVILAIVAISTGDSVRYLKLYDKATAPDPAVDVPVMRIPIPADAAGNGFVLPIQNGLRFDNGIAMSITGGVGDTDNTAVDVDEVVVNVAYRQSS